MTPRHRSSIVVPGLLAVALIAAGCQDSTTTALKRPSFWGGQEQCPTAKFTGGGRIDSPPVNSMPGKVTFGFNVFANGPNCTVSKGEIELVDHPRKISFHVSIHGGTDGAGNSVPYSVSGTCLTVGPMTGAERGPGATSSTESGIMMRVCDNGEPGSSPGIGPDTFRWKTSDDGDTGDVTGDTPLTGGNIQQH